MQWATRCCYSHSLPTPLMSRRIEFRYLYPIITHVKIINAKIGCKNVMLRLLPWLLCVRLSLCWFIPETSHISRLKFGNLFLMSAYRHVRVVRRSSPYWLEKPISPENLQIWFLTDEGTWGSDFVFFIIYFVILC